MTDLQHELGCLITELEGKIVPFVKLIPDDAPDDDMATQITLLLCGTSNALQDFYDKLDEEKNDS